MDLKKIILAAIAFMIISQVIHTIGAMIEMPFYLMEAYFPVWSKIMMPAVGPPPMTFYLISIAFSLAGGLIYAWLYDKVKPVLKGIQFGIALFLAVYVPSTLAMYLLINLPEMLLVSWAIQGLVIFLAAGILFEKIMK